MVYEICTPEDIVELAVTFHFSSLGTQRFDSRSVWHTKSNIETFAIRRYLLKLVIIQDHNKTSHTSPAFKQI